MTGCSQALKTEMKQLLGSFKEQPERIWTAPPLSW